MIENFLPKPAELEKSSKENFKQLAESQRPKLPPAARLIAIQFCKELQPVSDDPTQPAAVFYSWSIVCDVQTRAHIQTIENTEVLSALLGGLNIEGLKEVIKQFGGGEVEESAEDMASLINNFLGEKFAAPYDCFLYSLQADKYFLADVAGVKSGIVTNPQQVNFTDFVNIAEILQELTKEK